MSNQEYKECSIKMIDKIDNEKQLRRIFLLLHNMFIRRDAHD